MYGPAKPICFKNWLRMPRERERERERERDRDIMQNKALEVCKRKGKQRQCCLFQVDAKAFLRERELRELWLTFRLSPTNLCWVGRHQDNALWACHVCICSLSPILLYILHAKKYKRKVCMCSCFIPSRESHYDYFLDTRKGSVWTMENFCFSIILLFYSLSSYLVH